MNTKLLESLIKAGAFDSMGNQPPHLVGKLSDAIVYVQKRKEATAFGRFPLRRGEGSPMETFA
jgi:DNA polymerase-3 subunit alpha